MSDVQA